MIDPKRATEVSEAILGTCDSLSKHLFPGEDEDEMFEAIADEVVLCELCGWWVEAHETDEDGNCQDCQE